MEREQQRKLSLGRGDEVMQGQKTGHCSEGNVFSLSLFYTFHKPLLFITVKDHNFDCGSIQQNSNIFSPRHINRHFQNCMFHQVTVGHVKISTAYGIFNCHIS